MTAQQLSMFDVPSPEVQATDARPFEWIDNAPDWPANFGISCPAARPGGFRDTGEPHPYGDNGTYLEVSDAAADERRRRWHEIVGWADGYAQVDHPDWAELYRFMLSTCPYMVECYPNPHKWGPSFLINVRRPDRTLAHVGSICCRGGQLELNG